MKLYPYILVLFQFVLIGLLALTASLNSADNIYLLIVIIGIFLGLWAMGVMRGSKFRVTPDVAKGATLITKGPYKYLRHPMYTSVLFLCLGFLLSNINIFSIIFYLLLFVVLNLKISYEEKELIKIFPEYKGYKYETKKLIPIIY